MHECAEVCKICPYRLLKCRNCFGVCVFVCVRVCEHLRKTTPAISILKSKSIMEGV